MELLLKLADVIDEHAEELAQLESQNVGKPMSIAGDEMPFSADNLRFFAGAARTLEGKAAARVRRGLHVDRPARAARDRRRDHALELPADDGGLEARAGARRRERPDPEAGRADAADDASLRRARAGGPAAGRAQRDHRRRRAGRRRRSCGTPTSRSSRSPATSRPGKTIARNAADTLKRVHLELGGKAPMVVLDDADPAQVAEAVKIGGYWNSGQDCTASSRILVSERIYDDVMSRDRQGVEAMKVADPAEGDDVDMGPVISEEQRERVLGFLERARRRRRPSSRAAGRSATAASSSSRRSSPTWSRTTRSSSTRSSARSSRCSASPPTTRRSRWRTASATASPRRSSAATSAGRSPRRASSTSAPSG